VYGEVATATSHAIAQATASAAASAAGGGGTLIVSSGGGAVGGSEVYGLAGGVGSTREVSNERRRIKRAETRDRFNQAARAYWNQNAVKINEQRRAKYRAKRATATAGGGSGDDDVAALAAMRGSHHNPSNGNGGNGSGALYG
jgi:hypothetical protein